MIPLATLCDEYIDRLKLSEQKKPFEHVVPPPQEGSEQLRFQYLAECYCLSSGVLGCFI